MTHINEESAASGSEQAVDQAPTDKATDHATDKALAKTCSESMFEKDFFAQSLGIQIVNVTPGSATLIMAVTQNMLNGFGTCHGGAIFSLADTAFAYACNSRNEANVAMDCRIDFLKPIRQDEVLIAKATETHKGRKSGLYSVTIENQRQRILAQFTGRAFYVDQPVLSAGS